MPKDKLSEYESRYDKALSPACHHLEAHLNEILEGYPRIDRISARPKSISRFIKKSEKLDETGSLRYKDPIREIQDQLGARIITFYSTDVARIKEIAKRNLRAIEETKKSPESSWSFGYFGYHFIFRVPDEVKFLVPEPDLMPQFFELQIKTLFQHAWSEANHDLGYKPELGALGPHAARLLAFTSAQAWGADEMFDQLFVEQETENLARDGRNAS